MKTNKLLFLFVFLLLLVSCKSDNGGVSSQPDQREKAALIEESSFKPAKYLSITEIAKPGEETIVTLEDGASVTIPSNAIHEEVNVLVERNPEKVSALPSLGDDVIQVGDFYNFQIDGSLAGPVELVLPFDNDLIPDAPGILVFGVPTRNGWEFTPVIPGENTVNFSTTNLGDPIIAWHFVESDRIDLSYEIKEKPEELTVCDPYIPLDVNPVDGGFEISGQVTPVDKRYTFVLVQSWELKAAADIEVSLELNKYGWHDPADERTYTVVTDRNGAFNHVINQDDVVVGWNWVFAKAQCDEWWGKINVESKGSAEFKVEPKPPELVGDWIMKYDWDCDGKNDGGVEMVIFEDVLTTQRIFNSDGSADEDGDIKTAEWEFVNNELQIEYSSETTYIGEIIGNKIIGTMVGYQGKTGCWTAERKE